MAEAAVATPAPVADQQGSSATPAAGTPTLVLSSVSQMPYVAPPDEPAAPGGDSPATVTEQAAATPDDQDIWAKVTELDPEELIKRHPKLQGKIGSAAQKLAQRQTQETLDRATREAAAQQQKQQQAADRAKLRELADSDPDELARVIKERESRAEADEASASARAEYEQHVARQVQQQIDDVWNDDDSQEFLASLTEDQRQALNPYSGKFQSFGQWTKSFIKARTAYERTKLPQSKAVQERVAAEMKDQRLEQMTNEEPLGANLGVGGVSPGGQIFTASQIGAMSPEEYAKNRAAILAQYQSGQLVNDQPAVNSRRRF
ncbi:MAG: hypothetical protein U0821_18600 [Chloroflexota bacterium]